MIPCPNCRVSNQPGSTFCINCGAPLDAGRLQASARSLFWIITGRLGVSLLILWVLRSILTGLDFVRATVVPGLESFPLPDVISLAVYLGIAFMLVSYLQSLSRLWGQAFPNLAQAHTLINLVIYLVLFNQVYKGVSLLVTRTDADREILTFTGLALVIAAIVLAVRVFILVYQALPGWLASLKLDLTHAGEVEKETR